jgi:hypothetical protein
MHLSTIALNVYFIILAMGAWFYDYIRNKTIL